MLDAIFQFTDFEPFHGAELDTDIVLGHRRQCRLTDARFSPAKQRVATQESGRAYVHESLTGRHDPNSSSSTIRKTEASSSAKIGHKPPVDKPQLVIRTEESPNKLVHSKMGQAPKTVTGEQPHLQRSHPKQSIQSEANDKSHFNKPSRGSIIVSDAETLGKRRLSADPRCERNLNTNDSLSNYQSSSSNKGTGNLRFVEQNKVYASLQVLPKAEETPTGFGPKTSVPSSEASNYQINAAQFYNRHL